ncbi:MAG: hypothetical protein ACYDCO_01950 [Armatimonadota bacterium]
MPDLSTPTARLAHLARRRAERDQPYTVRPVPGLWAWVVRQIERELAGQANADQPNEKRGVA